MSKKIAPGLQEVVEAVVLLGGDGVDDVVREFRALLAVAKAAKKEVERYGHGAASGCCPLCRALARLDKISKRKEE